MSCESCLAVCASVVVLVFEGGGQGGNVARTLFMHILRYGTLLFCIWCVLSLCDIAFTGSSSNVGGGAAMGEGGLD